MAFLFPGIVQCTHDQLWRALRTLAERPALRLLSRYALANSSRSAPPSESKARKRNPRLSHLPTEELEEVPGIGPATLEKIKPFATV